MGNLAFELGIDWNSPAIIGVRDGVYPLQLCLVDDDNGTVISPCNPASIKAGDVLNFRVYDFTDPAFAPSGWATPSVLQILFTSASTVDTGAEPSPIDDSNGNPLTDLTSVNIYPGAPPSIAYDVQTGWGLSWYNQNNPLKLARSGRFKFRGLLTVGVTGKVARFYRVDPEMVVGTGGP